MKSFKSFIAEKVMAKHPFVQLKIPDMRKDENRVRAFLKKVREGKPFATSDKGDDVIIKKDEYDEVEAFLRADGGVPEKGKSLTVSTNKGKLVLVKDFLKTGEFGGRGKGSGTAAETLAMNYFNEKLNAILRKEAINHIELKINKKTVECAAMVKTSGSYMGKEPKSDMTIVDAEGKPVAFISHKAGRSAKDYQQYGGLSDKALPKNLTAASRKNIRDFMEAVLKERPEGLKSGDSFYRVVTDKRLVQQAMYGPEYGGKSSISNVDEFHLGNMNLKGRGKGPYTIESVHKGSNGEIPKGEYEAIFFIRYQARRGDARAAGVTVKNARVGIFPKAKIASTTKKI